MGCSSRTGKRCKIRFVRETKVLRRFSFAQEKGPGITGRGVPERPAATRHAAATRGEQEVLYES